MWLERKVYHCDMSVTNIYHVVSNIISQLSQIPLWSWDHESSLCYLLTNGTAIQCSMSKVKHS